MWFPAVRSSISIPPYSEPLAKLVDKEWHILGNPEAALPPVIAGYAAKWKGRFSADRISREIERRHGEDEDDEDIASLVRVTNQNQTDERRSGCCPAALYALPILYCPYF